MRCWYLLLAASSLFADKVPIHRISESEELPWFTGPLISQSALAVPVGHYDIEPYFFANAYTAAYNANWQAVSIPTLWNLILEPEMEFGLTSFMDFYLLPYIYYNFAEGHHSGGWGDLTAGLDFQIYRDVYANHDWYPDIKFSIFETFPMGKYKGLDPRKLGVQITGQGTYATTFQIVFGKMIHISGVHFTNTRLEMSYTLPTPVHVHGFSFYGGGYGARGKAYPSQIFFVDLSSEISLSQNWAFAIDIIGNWLSRVRFKGTEGTLLNGAPSRTPRGAGFQFIIAPALEYNFNASMGLIFGAEVTLAGKNLLQYRSGIIAFNYYN
ncbi:MAG: hypothetical protein HY069_02125 [Chlamydiia bacterium]|nr:hypothetical protein [Chlamydiia bacterium]